MTLTLSDLFCGAGGSSTGATQVPGVTVRVASNHWKLAVETHNTNHPDADHICADLSQIDPRYFPRTDILWASPECTNHSVAKGTKKDTGQLDMFEKPLPDEAAERSRATMWDVPRFAEHHKYQAVIVENVVDVAKWLPFRAWLSAMDSLGYDHELVSHNSMHASYGGAPAPQSRDRIYVVFNRKGNPRPDLTTMQRPLAYCQACGTDVQAIKAWKKPGAQIGRYRAQYVYRCPSTACRNAIVEPYWLPASSAIDWDIKGSRIGDRERPLADKTRARIAAGIAKYWGGAFTLEAAGHTFERRPGVRTWSVDNVLTTLHTTASKGLAIPLEGRDGKQAAPLTDPFRTQTTRLETGLAFIAELRGGGSWARPTSDPLATITAGGNHHALIMRNNTGGAEMVTPALEPMRTLTTAGHQSVLTPGDLAAAQAKVDDVLFRMLEPSEAKRGMAFPTDYVILGNRREQVRMAGNAVTPPAARDLIGAVAASLAGAA